MGKGSLALLLVLALVLLSLGPLGMCVSPAAAAASASTYYVGPYGSDNIGLGTLESPWRTIGHAIAAATDGDIIKIIDDGDETTDDYVEDVVVNKSLCIESCDKDGPNPQIRSGDGSGPVFNITADNVIIRGLDIYAPPRDIFGPYSAAIYGEGCRGCTVEGNRCGWDSDHHNCCGIYLSNAANCAVSANTCDYSENGSGIQLWGCYDCTVTRNSLSKGVCTGAFFVVGIAVRGGARNTVSSNAVSGFPQSGIDAHGTSFVIVGNTCVSNGGDGIDCAHISGCVMSNNLCKDNKGAGISIRDDSSNNTVTGNTSSGNKHGISLYNRADMNNIYLNWFSSNLDGSVRSGTNGYGQVGNNSWASSDNVAYTYRGRTYKGRVGNYYSEYIGADDGSNGRVVGDGIGDTNLPFATDGAGDSYPLMDGSGIRADFAVSNAAGMAPLTVQFTDKSIGKATAWAWDFDADGTTDSTEQNPWHTYTTPGIYTVTLTVAGDAGESERTRFGCVVVVDPLVWQQVSPNAGATVVTPDQTVKLDFPVGSVSEESIIYIAGESLYEGETPPAGFEFGETLFRVGGASNLAKEVGLTVMWSDLDMAAAGGDMSRLSLSRYDDESEEWFVVNTVADASTGTLGTSTSQFSRWAVVVKGGDSSPSQLPTWVWVVLASVVMGALGLLLGHRLARR